MFRLASDANDFGWGAHTLQEAMEFAHEYFSEEKSVESSSYRELLGVLRCLQSLTHMCVGKLVVFQVDAQNLSPLARHGIGQDTPATPDVQNFQPGQGHQSVYPFQAQWVDLVQRPEFTFRVPPTVGQIRKLGQFGRIDIGCLSVHSLDCR